MFTGEDIPSKRFKRGKPRVTEYADEKNSIEWKLKNFKDLKTIKMMVVCKRCHKLVAEIRIVSYDVKNIWMIDVICRKCKTDLNPASTDKYIQDKAQVKIDELAELYEDAEDKTVHVKTESGRL